MSLPITSEVDICAYALRLIGDQPITALTDNSDRARLCNSIYALTRDATLRAHPWNFATFRAALATATKTTGTNPIITTLPAFEYTQAYTLPNGGGTDLVTDPPYCLRVLYTSFDMPDRWDQYGVRTNSWRIEGRYLFTRFAPSVATSPPQQLFVTYIGRALDISTYDPLFTTALAARMAAQMALPLKGSPKLMDSSWKLYVMALAEARSINGQEGTPSQLSDTTLLDVRN